ncbi:MAG: tRNA uridine-5-carboxymethylaminomethyl(34) synthesis GTPase MnmE [Candidatus Hydrogenedens sp.]|nr:tRNA uridine-5-carboxymethylaminomethyl(34) synthesis GTPase MnmE [Candidatus Hydrogenedens sp.]
MSYLYSDDTIAAISTPPGEGGVGIVRLSGPASLSIAAKVFVSSRAKNISKGSQRVYHGHVLDEEGNPLDEVLLHIMRAPHSYTAEDVVEINGHGGRASLQAILECVLAQGARLAQPGEFTRRAFVNGRIDLTRAEAVMDLIHAKTRAALRMAESASSGRLAGQLQALANLLKECLALAEAAVDFPEEDLPELITPAFFARLEKAKEEMAALVKSTDTGLLLQEGASIAIVGRPNVGKSSIFNLLLRDARAIVSPEPGTTRDQIEETLTLGGIPVRLCDTAGLRKTEHAVESQGIERSRQAARRAALLLFVADASSEAEEEESLLAEEMRQLEVPVVFVLNKIDLPAVAERKIPDIPFAALCHVSAMTGEGMEELEKTLVSLLAGDLEGALDSPALFRSHQKDSMQRALKCVQALLENRDASPEILALELRDALSALGSITGETTSEEVLDIIFGSFCIGK